MLRRPTAAVGPERRWRARWRSYCHFPYADRRAVRHDRHAAHRGDGSCGVRHFWKQPRPNTAPRRDSLTARPWTSRPCRPAAHDTTGVTYTRVPARTPCVATRGGQAWRGDGQASAVGKDGALIIQNGCRRHPPRRCYFHPTQSHKNVDGTTRVHVHTMNSQTRRHFLHGSNHVPKPRS